MIAGNLFNSPFIKVQIGSCSFYKLKFPLSIKEREVVVVVVVVVEGSRRRDRGEAIKIKSFKSQYKTYHLTFKRSHSPFTATISKNSK